MVSLHGRAVHSSQLLSGAHIALKERLLGVDPALGIIKSYIFLGFSSSYFFKCLVETILYRAESNLFMKHAKAFCDDHLAPVLRHGAARKINIKNLPRASVRQTRRWEVLWSPIAPGQRHGT